MILRAHVAVVGGGDRDRGHAAFEQLVRGALRGNVPRGRAVIRSEHDDVGFLLLGEPFEALAG